MHSDLSDQEMGFRTGASPVDTNISAILTSLIGIIVLTTGRTGQEGNSFPTGLECASWRTFKVFSLPLEVCY